MDIRPSHPKCGQGLHLRGTAAKGPDGTILRCSPEQTGKLRQEQDCHQARIDQDERYYRRAKREEAAIRGRETTLRGRTDRGRSDYPRARGKEAAIRGSQIKNAGRIRQFMRRVVVGHIPQISNRRGAGPVQRTVVLKIPMIPMVKAFMTLKIPPMTTTHSIPKATQKRKVLWTFCGHRCANVKRKQGNAL